MLGWEEKLCHSQMLTKYTQHLYTKTSTKGGIKVNRKIIITSQLESISVPKLPHPRGPGARVLSLLPED